MKTLHRFLAIIIFIGATMIVIVVASHINDDNGYINSDLGGIIEDEEYEQLQYIYNESAPARTPQPRLSVPDRYPDDMILPIASGYIYHVVIGNSVFPIQDHMDFYFVPPARAEFVYIGTIAQVIEWELAEGRTPSFQHDYVLYCDGMTFIIVDMYDHNDNHTDSIVRWSPDPDANLNPDMDNVRFIGTWNQIRAYCIVDLDKLYWLLHPVIDPYDIYYVRFTGSWGAWRIQDARDWNFAPPSYVEVETELIEHEDFDELLMIITFNLFDENRNLYSHFIERLWFAHDDIRPFPCFSGTYRIGTLAELGGVGS